MVVFLQSEDQGSQFVIFARLQNVADDEPVDEGGCLSLPFGGGQVRSVLHPPQAVDVQAAMNSTLQKKLTTSPIGCPSPFIT